MYWYTYGGQYPMRVPNYGDILPEASLDYWTRSLLQRMTALIDVQGVPQASETQYGWDINALKYQLFLCGFSVVFKDREYGVVPQPGTLTGFGLQFQPTGALINSPYFTLTRPLVLGKEAQLIMITPDYTGIFDIVAKYATELRELDVSLKSATRNARLGYTMVADSDKTARTLRGVREKIINGDDVIIDEKLAKKRTDGSYDLPWYLFDRDVKQSYIVNDLLQARRDTLVDFYREIGVRMLENKKERMLTDEVNAGQAETFIRSEVWAETLKNSVKKVNDMFGTQLSITINEPDVLPQAMKEGGPDDVSE